MSKRDSYPTRRIVGRASSFKKFLIQLTIALLVLGYLLEYHNPNHHVLPTPSVALPYLLENFDKVLTGVLVTAGHVAIGLFSAWFIGMPLGLLIPLNKPIERIASAFTRTLASIPRFAMVLVAVLVLPRNEIGIIIFFFLMGVIYSIELGRSTATDFLVKEDGKPNDLVEALESLGFKSRTAMLFLLLMPLTRKARIGLLVNLSNSFWASSVFVEFWIGLGRKNLGIGNFTTGLLFDTVVIDAFWALCIIIALCHVATADALTRWQESQRHSNSGIASSAIRIINICNSVNTTFRPLKVQSHERASTQFKSPLNQPKKKPRL